MKTCISLTSTLVFVLIFLLPKNSAAEALITTLSSETIYISSNFSGADVTLFGSIVRDARTVSRAEPYLLAVKLQGPPLTMVTRKKDSFWGVWVNKSSATYTNVPAFYSINTSIPLEELTIPAVLQREQIGLENLIIDEIETGSESVVGNDYFRQAFLDLRQQHGYYFENYDAIKMLNAEFFRTTFSLPATVPVGEYTLTVYLFRGASLLSIDNQKLKIAKTGFGQFTYSLAHQNSLVYGLVTVFLAMFIGWLASIIFRRD